MKQQSEKIKIGDDWTLRLGDSVETVSDIKDDSIGLAVYSPPFPGVYTYSDDDRDMGNSASLDEFFAAYQHLAKRMLPKMMPGRNCCVHLQQIAALKQRDGYTGIVDFRGPTIKCMSEAGWMHVGEIAIDKDPQVAAVRTKAQSLLFATLEKDSAINCPCLLDMILIFRRPGDNPEPVKPDISREDWIEWARPVWPSGENGIRQTRTLNAAEGRDSKDERHICPLQLDVIDRCVRLWSNQGDLVYSPFAGIGSEGYSALQLGRKFEGGELKPSYFKAACRNLDMAVAQRGSRL